MFRIIKISFSQISLLCYQDIETQVPDFSPVFIVSRTILIREVTVFSNQLIQNKVKVKSCIRKTGQVSKLNVFFSINVVRLVNKRCNARNLIGNVTTL